MGGGEGRSKRGLFHFLMSELIPIRFSLSHTVHHIHVTLKWMNEIANNCTMYTVWTENAYGFGHHILCATLTDKTCARCLAAVRPICLFIYFLLLLSLLDIYPIAPVCGKYDFFFFCFFFIYFITISFHKYDWLWIAAYIVVLPRVYTVWSKCELAIFRYDNLHLAIISMWSIALQNLFFFFSNSWNSWKSANDVHTIYVNWIILFVLAIN